MTPEQIQAQHDRVNAEIELHNDAQERIVQRAQDMVKMLFLVSGGALAVCANFFSDGKSLNYETIAPIRVAWVALTSSMLLFGITLLLLLARDYFFGEARGRSLETMVEQEDVSPNWTRAIWATGLLGFVFFAVGMAAFTYSAWVYLGTSK